jgi:hypothetical protein
MRFNLPNNTQQICLFVLLFSQFLFSNDIIGIKINYSNPQSKIYLGSPSIEILPNGHYVASHDHFGAGTKDQPRITSVCLSTDKGKTWEKQTDIANQFWSKLFHHNGALYIFGTSAQYGNLLIRKSVDEGKTWTEPVNGQTGLLRDDYEYHTAPMPFVKLNGRIYRAVEIRNPPSGWGIHFRALVVSANEDADLLDANSWTTSNSLGYDQEWDIGTAWLEGNMVIGLDGHLFNFLRVNEPDRGGYAARINVSPDGKKISFDPEKDFIHFPGGCKKFVIRYDEKTRRYWTLSNHTHDIGYNPERTRNCLTLSSSPDLLNWTVHKEIIYHPDFKLSGFQYPDWLFDGDDIIAVVRVAFDDGNEKPHNCHDANYMCFYRIDNFAEKLDENIARYINK